MAKKQNGKGFFIPGVVGVLEWIQLEGVESKGVNTKKPCNSLFVLLEWLRIYK